MLHVLPRVCVFPSGTPVSSHSPRRHAIDLIGDTGVCMCVLLYPARDLWRPVQVFSVFAQ